MKIDMYYFQYKEKMSKKIILNVTAVNFCSQRIMGNFLKMYEKLFEN